MRLRSRVALAATAAVLISVIAVSVAVYLSIGHELRRQVDVTLREQGERFASFSGAGGFPPPSGIGQVPNNDEAVFTDSYLQVLDSNGTIMISLGAGPLPETAASVRVATGEQPATFEDVNVDGDPVRAYTVPTRSGALRFGRSLEEVDRILDRLTIAMVIVGLLAIVVAGLLGRAFATKAIAPVLDLSDTARAIKRTGDLSRRLPVHGNDEVASMAASFNDVLDDLETSQALQRQLVADASHELRTPLTTLRTNIEVLARGHDLPPQDGDRILADLTHQLEDLTELVGDLIDLARDETSASTIERVRLDEVATEVVDRARRQRPMIRFTLDDEPCTVEAAPDRLDRAISNLVDNAAKWSPVDGAVRVTVARGTVAVSDDGPGIDPVDLPHIFDRFYRSSTARSMPGSGLGLAIVKQVAETFGGTVDAQSQLGKGSTLLLRLPLADL